MMVRELLAELQRLPRDLEVLGLEQDDGHGLDEPWRMSPAANTPGGLVPSGSVPRRPGHPAGAPRGR